LDLFLNFTAHCVPVHLSVQKVNDPLWPLPSSLTGTRCGGNVILRVFMVDFQFPEPQNNGPCNQKRLGFAVVQQSKTLFMHGFTHFGNLGKGFYACKLINITMKT